MEGSLDVVERNYYHLIYTKIQSKLEYTIINRIKSRKFWSIQLYFARKHYYCVRRHLSNNWNQRHFRQESWKDCFERPIRYWSWWWDAWIACDHHACMSMNRTGHWTKPSSFTSTSRMRRCSEHIGYLMLRTRHTSCELWPYCASNNPLLW
jgi:hypothetical protein